MSYLSSVIDRDKCVCPGLRCLFADHGAACTDSISRSPKTPRSSSSPGRTGRARTGMQTRAWTTRCARLSLCAILGRRNGEQMIIHIPFTENVRLRSMLLKLGGVQSLSMIIIAHHDTSTGRGELTPRHLRIYANHNTIVDFADAESTKPQLNISLLEGETGVVEYPLHVAAFASVHSLSLFFVSVVRVFLLQGSHLGRTNRRATTFRGCISSGSRAMCDQPSRRWIRRWMCPLQTWAMPSWWIGCRKRRRDSRLRRDSVLFPVL